MTTQRELIRTFLNGENSPSTASNMDIIPVRGGSKAYLVGGYVNEHYPGAVYAVREPINQLTLYQDFRFNPSPGQVGCSTYAISDQYRKLSQEIADGYENEFDLTLKSGDDFSNRERPSTRDFDRLDEELHG